MPIIAHAPTSFPIAPPDRPSTCPPWCVDCWKGDAEWNEMQPGLAFHNGETRTITVPAGAEPHEVEISLERMDDEDGPCHRRSCWRRSCSLCWCGVGSDPQSA